MRAALALIALAFAVNGCGANPLLKAAASDYAPVRLGSAWTYQSLDAATTLQRDVIAAGPYNGLEAFTLATVVNGGPASLSYIAFDNGEMKQHDPTLGWILFRRLPLVSGGKWPVPTANPLVTATTVVDGIENVDVPAGSFSACFRVRSRTETFNPGSGLTSTAESLAWAAPGVGDVRYGSIAADGSETITFVLTGYSIP